VNEILLSDLVAVPATPFGFVTFDTCVKEGFVPYVIPAEVTSNVFVEPKVIDRVLGHARKGVKTISSRKFPRDPVDGILETKKNLVVV
jgi:hypothetical protein